jgi:hypothetical protein
MLRAAGKIRVPNTYLDYAFLPVLTVVAFHVFRNLTESTKVRIERIPLPPPENKGVSCRLIDSEAHVLLAAPANLVQIPFPSCPHSVEFPTASR